MYLYISTFFTYFTSYLQHVLFNVSKLWSLCVNGLFLFSFTPLCDIHDQGQLGPKTYSALESARPYSNSARVNSAHNYILLVVVMITFIDLFENLAKHCFPVHCGFSSGELHQMKYITELHDISIFLSLFYRLRWKKLMFLKIIDIPLISIAKFCNK
jgi:hypothetical protein